MRLNRTDGRQDEPINEGARITSQGCMGAALVVKNSRSLVLDWPVNRGKFSS
jgi:hypothetical protein